MRVCVVPCINCSVSRECVFSVLAVQALSCSGFRSEEFSVYFSAAVKPMSGPAGVLYFCSSLEVWEVNSLLKFSVCSIFSHMSENAGTFTGAGMFEADPCLCFRMLCHSTSLTLKQAESPNATSAERQQQYQT